MKALDGSLDTTSIVSDEVAEKIQAGLQELANIKPAPMYVRIGCLRQTPQSDWIVAAPADADIPQADLIVVHPVEGGPPAITKVATAAAEGIEFSDGADDALKVGRPVFARLSPASR